MDSNAIRQQLRESRSPSLRRRRRIAGLAAVGLVDFALISLYQLGVVRHLPDPPGRVFDSDQVNASRKAYALGAPDGTTGALMYAATLVLTGAGGSRETGRPRAFDWLLGGAVLVGAAAALQYLWDMARKQQKACPYCLVGAAASLAMLPPALRELRAR